MEETARKLFNADTIRLYYDEQKKAINTIGEGSKVNADYLSKLAQEDLPLAVELLSKLTVSGQISQKTLTKMLTIWHSPLRRVA